MALRCLIEGCDSDSVKRHTGILWMIAVFIVLVFAPALSYGASDSAEADFMPWSGYWWPTNGGGLATGISYRGHPAPLEKYELLKDGAYPGLATRWYLDHNYDPYAPGWYGLCGAWAAASVSENIEFYPSIIDGIIFNVGDKKGLLTACHENDVTIRINSHEPEVFHEWLLQYIKDSGIAFYAELEPGEEVWNYPIYRYEMDTLNYGDSISVTCRIWYADDLVDPDYQGTKTLTKLYTYILYKGENNEITGGEWTGASIYNHPQQLVLPLSQSTNNPYLDYDFIRNIAVSRDDELESDQTVDISPGGYNLILLNEDVYRITCDEGDTILLHVEKKDDFEQGISVVILDADERVVYSDTIHEEKDITIDALTTPYTLTFARDDYGGGGVYHLDFDLKKAFEFANLKIQKGFGWGGFAITNAGDMACDRIYVVGYGKDGLPTETYVGSFSLASGQKRTVMISDFDVSVVDRDDFTGVKVLAPSALKVVNLFGYFEKNMSCYSAMNGRSRFVIPDFSTWWDYSHSVSWGIYNPGLEDQNVSAELFSPDGGTVDSVSLTIPANRAVHYNSSDSPFAVDENNGWALIAVDDGNALQGYTEWLENGIAKAEAMGTLGVGKIFFVPHVADTSFWNQSITLINVSNTINSITITLVDGSTLEITDIILNPYEKETTKITDLFPYVDSEALNLSGLVIAAEQDIAGFVSLETSGDDMYYSLLDETDIFQALVIPHVASNDYWWSGFALFNPSCEAVEFRILPYDADGHVIAEHTLDRTIEAKRKSVFTVSDLFGDQASGISFIKFKVLNGPGLAGVFGYGNADCSMLSGSVMR